MKCGAKLKNGKICQKPPVPHGIRCAQHGGLSTGAKTMEGKERCLRIKTGVQYHFLLKCSICPPSLQCALYDKERAYCPSEEEILREDVNVQAIREQRIKALLIILKRCQGIFTKTGKPSILRHVEKADDHLQTYLKDYERIAPRKGESFIEKLSKRRKELERRRN